MVLLCPSVAGSQMLCFTANTVGSGSHFHPEQVTEPPSDSSSSHKPGKQPEEPLAVGQGSWAPQRDWDITDKTGSVHCSLGFVFYFHIFSLIFSSPLFKAGLFC